MESLFKWTDCCKEIPAHNPVNEHKIKILLLLALISWASRTCSLSCPTGKRNTFCGWSWGHKRPSPRPTWSGLIFGCHRRRWTTVWRSSPRWRPPAVWTRTPGWRWSLPTWPARFELCCRRRDAALARIISQAPRFCPWECGTRCAWLASRRAADDQSPAHT